MHYYLNVQQVYEISAGHHSISTLGTKHLLASEPVDAFIFKSSNYMFRSIVLMLMVKLRIIFMFKKAS